MKRYAASLAVALLVACSWLLACSTFTEAQTDVRGAGYRPTLTDVLAAGNTSGAVDLVVNASQGLVVGGATTAGVRLEVNSGVLTAREGDDSADAPLQALSLTSPTLTATTSLLVGAGTLGAAEVLDVTGGATRTDVSVLGGNPGGAAAGGAVSLTGGQGGATGDGGNATLTGGAGGSTSGVGGNANLTGGATTSGDGGGVNLNGGAGSGGSGGGSVAATGGAGNGAAAGGTVTGTGGTGGATGAGGAATLTGGAGGSTSGAGGAATLQGGLPVDGNGGAVSITGRAGVGTNRSGGNVNLDAGAATGSGTAGVIACSDDVVVASGSAVVVGGATTAGARLEVNAGVLTVREGDDSADAPLQALSLVSPTVTVSGVTFANHDTNAIAIQTGGTTRVAWYPALRMIMDENAVRAWGSAAATIQFTAHTGGQVTLTDGVATTVVTIELPTTTRCGGTITYTIEASDGTDFQSLSGQVRYAAVNKAGVYTTQITEEVVQAAVQSAVSTLTDTWTITTGTNLINIQLNADSSLTTTTLRVQMQVQEGSGQAITIQ